MKYNLKFVYSYIYYSINWFVVLFLDYRFSFFITNEILRYPSIVSIIFNILKIGVFIKTILFYLFLKIYFYFVMVQLNFSIANFTEFCL